MSKIVYRDKKIQIEEQKENGLTYYIVHYYTSSIWYPYRDSTLTIVKYYDIEHAKSHITK